jgi:membrane protein YqaA with SNARE-associated domain
MDTGKIVTAGLLGGVVAFILGYLMYGIIMADFFQSNMGSATGVMRGDADMQWVPLILGHLSWGLLFAIIYGRWASISTFATGAKAGAVLGFLVAFTTNMINYGTTNIANLNAVLGDIVVMTIVAAIVGGTVGWFLGRK